MSVHTVIADEFPLLAAVAQELDETADGGELARLRMARRLLQDAFQSLDQTQGPPVRFCG